jgi:hypothetical protein
MAKPPKRIPPGPTEKFETDHDLLRFMEENFHRYGDIYKASIYGGDVYVVRSPAYAEVVLLKNWGGQAYRSPSAMGSFRATENSGRISGA